MTEATHAPTGDITGDITGNSLGDNLDGNPPDGNPRDDNPPDGNPQDGNPGAGSGPKIVLGRNQYGKAEVRLVKVSRDTARHHLEDLSITSQLHGDFEAAHTQGNNSRVVATDTQKNTIYAFARDGVGSPEEFLMRLARHFTSGFDWVTGGRWAAEQYFWNRINNHDHAFAKDKSEVRTAVLLSVGGQLHLVSGISGLTVLKSTGSEFHGFPRDRFTTLAETTDRVLATDVTAKWRYAAGTGSGVADFNTTYASVRNLLLEAFANTHSLALQQTMFEMGRAVLEVHPEIEEVRLSLPNNHHFLVDLAPFGLDNPQEVFFAADRPYGLIEASVLREGAGQDSPIWDSIGGFC
ncbi:urate oxidase [Arthrobacter sp. zg-Y820]|uniref:factor-independent urate hydroxylase n=1 Tax=unclassified Arthrobacter TaxID=235627 RepID=UPI001E5A40AC|nr:MULTISPECIES: urate oxidase [unclassified Arthrobacter]MCC9197195.1 urate oxidase [Arthrobacter sp. zg-Y820]MDK1280060.1 urate oxidase [Arthrobacter sp. zg.Y820]WIB09354.1 urate oxidase [Arthrobacter sp. zg-Y820]